MCDGEDVCTSGLFGPSYWKTNIIHNSFKYKMAFLFSLTKHTSLTPSQHLLHRHSGIEVKLRRSL